ncbi:hypothetical protein ACU686_41035 [Yinghuangia aomiensis]
MPARRGAQAADITGAGRRALGAEREPYERGAFAGAGEFHDMNRAEVRTDRPRVGGGQRAVHHRHRRPRREAGVKSRRTSEVGIERSPPPPL